MKETFKIMKEKSKLKREENRNSGPTFLERAGIPFTVKNNGAHLIVEGSQGFIDYWPGTGKWIARTGKRGFGVNSLVTAIQFKGEV